MSSPRETFSRHSEQINSLFIGNYRWFSSCSLHRTLNVIHSLPLDLAADNLSSLERNACFAKLHFLNVHFDWFGIMANGFFISFVLFTLNTSAENKTSTEWGKKASKANIFLPLKLMLNLCFAFSSYRQWKSLRERLRIPEGKYTFHWMKNDDEQWRSGCCQSAGYVGKSARKEKNLKL